jgi:hypothetical protein
MLQCSIKEYIMENGKKSTTVAPTFSPASALAGWARQGLESFVATQKILLDLAAQQNSLALGFVRERMNFSPLRPLTAIVDLAGQGLANFVAAQKILLDLAAEENGLMLQGVRDGLGLTGTPALMTDAIREGVDEFVGMQKKFLDMVDAQAQAAVGVITEGKPYEGKSMAEVTRQGLENFVHTQKKFLELVTDAANYGKGGQKALKPMPHRKVSTTVQEGVDKFVDAQKKLLDVAAEQIEGAMKTTEEMMRPSPEPSTTVGEFARRGVENFISAQKSLLDVAMKPFMPPPPHTPAHAHTGRRK